MHPSVHFFKFFLQILRDVNETQTYKCGIVKGAFKPLSRIQNNLVATLGHTHPLPCHASVGHGHTPEILRNHLSGSMSSFR